jgi:biotin-(acetyl-CoA carboxylase) ligase
MLIEYNNRLFKKGELVKFKQHQIGFTGKVIGVNAVGQLIVEHGIEQTYNFGELIWEI